MTVKAIIDEDFSNYRLPCLIVGTAKCDWKCCVEQHLPNRICQNNPIAKLPNRNISNAEILQNFLSNPITQAVVVAGLEPVLQKDEVLDLIQYFRQQGEMCDFVIYTGYYEYEIEDFIEQLKPLKNIILKTGRFIPNQSPHYDEILGVDLASDNQKGVRIC